MLNRKHFFLGALFGLVLLAVYFYTLPDGLLHIIFCDVGQGDAIYIRAPNGADMLLDEGPNERVLVCLGRHMPFYDRSIDVVTFTHAQKDHLGGLTSVLLRFRVANLVVNPVIDSETEYASILSLARSKGVDSIRTLTAGDGFSLGEVIFHLNWPTRDYVGDYSRALASERSTALGKTDIGGNVLGVTESGADVNVFSYLYHLRYGQFDALFTGDGDSKIQDKLLSDADLEGGIEVLKVPHHGSKTSLLPAFLDKLKPVLGIISVGKNSYGHPAPELLSLLASKGVKTMRTDREGDIEVVSDGKRWWIR